LLSDQLIMGALPARWFRRSRPSRRAPRRASPFHPPTHEEPTMAISAPPSPVRIRDDAAAASTGAGRAA